MGSFLLHDDYRLPDFSNLGLPYKKDRDTGTAALSGGGGQAGLFDNNMCFANIKRSLGFGDVPAANDAAGENEEDWGQYNMARASPVVERLILEEIKNDIADNASVLGISMDPRQWGVEATRKWLQWVANLYQIGDQTNCLLYDGRILCGFTEEDFVYLTGSDDIGPKIAAQLDLWKKAIRMMPSAGGSYHFQQQQIMDQKLGTVPVGRPDNTPKLLDESCSWASAQAPQQQYTSTSDLLSTSNRLVNGGRGDTDSVSAGTPNYQNMTNATFQPYNIHTSLNVPSYPAESLGRSTPRPTIPLDRFRSVREACQDNGFLTWEKYQEFTSITPPKHALNMMNSAALNKSIIPSTAPAPNTFNIDTIQTPNKINTPTTFNIKKEQLPISSQSEPPLNTKTSVRDTAADRVELIPSKLKTEKVEIGSDLTAPELPTSKGASEDTPKKKLSKHPIHLWEFLKQLLCDGGKDCIRWIDQEKGVFKIYNSQEVAKFWGERKNRPAMNYDKLSRSIRQYYKKGIIKKTTQGKRLVYQFCQGYI